MGRMVLTVVAAMVAALMLGVSAARADYEQVPEHFGVSGDAMQLEEGLGVAVNEAGAGGVEPGSLYVVGRNSRVVRYAAGVAGAAPAFREAWGWGLRQGASEEEYERCGPAVEEEEGVAAHCKPIPLPVTGGEGGEEVGHFNSLAAVAVNQSNGYVYVLNLHTARRNHHLIEVFTAKGTPIGEGFGDAGRKSPAPSESIAEGPEQLHEMFATEGGMAVDEAGTVYVSDSDYPVGVENPQTRVMSWQPESPGDYEHYVYAGTSHDISVSAVSGVKFSKLALVSGDRLVVANRELIREYRIGAGNTPKCSRPVSGQLEAMTANPVTGEVFYFTSANGSVHRLGSCAESSGTFEELPGAVRLEPETRKVYGLVVDAGLAWGPTRPVGTLYAVDAQAHGEQWGIGDILAPAQILAPEILTESVGGSTTISANLRARIDPRGFATSYRFEYIAAATYAAQKAAAEGEGKSGEEAESAGFAGAAQAPSVPGTIGGGVVGTATAAISGLAPDTSFAFRVLATSECEGPGGTPCEARGQAASFATYPPVAAGLPDNRAYELVSPTQKNGGEVFAADPRVTSCGSDCKPPGTAITAVFPMQSAPDGDAVAYMGNPFSPTAGAAVFNSYISRRTGAGWQTAAMSPALLATAQGEDLAFDPLLQEGTIFQENPQLPSTPAAPAGYANLYLQETAAPGALTPLIASPPPHRARGSFTLEYAGSAPSTSAQFFAANDALTGATPYAPAPPDPTSVGRDLYEWRGGALSLVNVLPGNLAVAAGAAFASVSPDTHAISADGRRVYWRVGSALYVREAGRVTREVKHPGTFLTASEDGLEVLMSDGCLYSLRSESCTDLTQGEGGFEGIAGANGDLSRIYFVDTAALAGSGGNAYGDVPQVGKDNLYVYTQGAGSRFVATLAASDGAGTGETLADWVAAPTRRTAEASPAGRFLTFASTLPLTGHGNVGPCGEQFDSERGEYVTVQAPCSEVFLYDSATGRLTCPSCNPTGEAPLGPSTLRRIAGERAWQPQPRYLTDSGRLYFDSSDRLSPRDVNGRVEDVYEAEPAGAGSCVRAAGCVTLISPGTGAVDSNFLAADQSGANVFFTAREQLVPRDVDHLVDLYDAREGGGFPGEAETAAGPCQGEVCQGPGSTSGAQAQAGTSSFTGPGNPAQAKAKNCSAPTKQAKRLSARAKKLRRQAKKASDPAKAKRLRAKANRTAKQARGKSKAAKTCRGGGSTNRVTRRVHADHRRAR